jgi:hypothetical protein
MSFRSNLVAAGVVGLLALVGVGCDEEYKRESDASADSSEAADTPENRARANSDEGAAALAESDKGVDADGEKTWKQDAREYFDYAKNPKNRTFEMPGQWARDLTAKLYAAGATHVWVTRISESTFGETSINMSDDLLIVLPDDPAKRKAVFELYNGAVADEELKFPDIGQKYIHIVAD